jgi:hypothetical protein
MSSAAQKEELAAPLLIWMHAPKVEEHYGEWDDEQKRRESNEQAANKAK